MTLSEQTSIILSTVNHQLSSYKQDYLTRELTTAHKRIAQRSKLGPDHKTETPPDPATAIDRIDWLLNGSYGAGEYFLALNIIRNNLHNKTSPTKIKSLERAWLAVGRELTMLVALLDSTDYTFKKTTATWKAQGHDFHSLNQKAADAIREHFNQYAELEDVA